jgi:hypothetical protein
MCSYLRILANELFWRSNRHLGIFIFADKQAKMSGECFAQSALSLQLFREYIPTRASLPKIRTSGKSTRNSIK